MNDMGPPQSLAVEASEPDEDTLGSSWGQHLVCRGWQQCCHDFSFWGFQIASDEEKITLVPMTIRQQGRVTEAWSMSWEPDQHQNDFDLHQLSFMFLVAAVSIGLGMY